MEQDLAIRRTYKESLEQQRLIECFEQIVRNKSGALNTLKAAYRDRVSIFVSKLGFHFYRNEDWTDFCECWFEFEYFNFIRDKHFDEPMLQRVLQNLRTGVCPHIANQNKDESSTENTKLNYGLTSLKLYYATAAVGNKKCFKYLYKTDPCSVMFCQSANGLLPVEIAVLKQQKETFKSKFKPCDVHNHHLDIHNLIVAKRMSSTGKVAIIKRPRDQTRYFNMLEIMDTASDKIVKTVIKNSYSPNTTFVVTYLFMCFLFNGKFKHALQIVNICGGPNTFRCKREFLVAAIMVDADNVVRRLLERDRICFGVKDALFHDLRLADIAVAFKSSRCRLIKKFNSLVKRTDGIFETISPFAYFIYFYQYQMDYLPESVFELLPVLGEDYYINQQDRYGMTPLHIAIEQIGYNSLLINQLLDMGADVNIQDAEGRTPLLIAASMSTYHFFPFDSRDRPVPCKSRALLKEILFRNPLLDNCPSVISQAIEIDLNNENLTFIKSASRTILRDRKYSGVLGKEDERADDIAVLMTEPEQVVASSWSALLHEVGFDMSSTDYNLITSEKPTDPKRHKDNAPFLLTYFDEVQSTPLPLKHACRLVVRKQYPGTLLHDMLEQEKLPYEIKDYILFTDCLKFVDFKTTWTANVKQKPDKDGEYWFSVDALPYVCDKGLTKLGE